MLRAAVTVQQCLDTGFPVSCKNKYTNKQKPVSYTHLDVYKRQLKQGQDKPTAKQKEKHEKAQDKSLKADKPKKSKGMKM